MFSEDIQNHFNELTEISPIAYRIILFPIYIMKKILFKKIKSDKNKFHSTVLDPSIPANNFCKNMKMMHSICCENQIIFLSLLQPLNGIGNRDLTEADQIILSNLRNHKISEKQTAFNFHSEYYMHIKKGMSGTTFFKDFTNIFYAQKGQIFFDTCHFSDIGQEHVADEICKLVLNEVGNDIL